MPKLTSLAGDRYGQIPRDVWLQASSSIAWIQPCSDINRNNIKSAREKRWKKSNDRVAGRETLVVRDSRASGLNSGAATCENR